MSPPSATLSPADACRTVHQLLSTLPVFTAPKEVPFQDGLYFFYQSSEKSLHGVGGRVVRVGNHPRADGGLKRRLQQHYSGSKNGSVFRRFLGGALLRRAAPGSPCLSPGPGQGHWEQQDERCCDSCRDVEKEVSAILRASFHFRCISVRDRTVRNHLEALLIATLAACPTCMPSPSWLGLDAYSKVLRRSGLWNSQHVDSDNDGRRRPHNLRAAC